MNHDYDHIAATQGVWELNRNRSQIAHKHDKYVDCLLDTAKVVSTDVTLCIHTGTWC